MVLAAVAVVGFTVMGTLHVVAALAHEEVTAAHTYDRDGIDTLEVHADDGTVRIVGTDDDVISIDETISEGLRATGHRVVRRGSSLVAESTCPNFLSYFCRVDYTIRVPVAVEVVVRAGGDVNVSDVRGDVDLATDHGDISVERIEGDARFSADHGSVSASFAAPPRSVDASSDHGDVDLVLPRGDEVYRVDASTDHGSTDVGVRQDPESGRVVRARADHGDVTVRYSAR